MRGEVGSKFTNAHVRGRGEMNRGREVNDGARDWGSCVSLVHSKRLFHP